MSTQTGRLVRFARRRLPHLLAAAIAGSFAFAAMPVLAQAANTSVQSFNISGGQLDRVLNEFATASGVVLSVDAAVTAGKQSQPGLCQPLQETTLTLQIRGSIVTPSQVGDAPVSVGRAAPAGGGGQRHPRHRCAPAGRGGRAAPRRSGVA